VPLERWPNEQDMWDELHGGAWADQDGWETRCQPEGCVVCVAGRPFGILAELAHSWVTTDPEVALFGYVCVISKVHVVEPYDLTDAQLFSFFKEAMDVARIVSHIINPIKMNYEIHGNTLPHLHMHLLPRKIDDGFVGRPIDLKDFHHTYTDDEVAMLKRALEPLGG